MILLRTHKRIITVPHNDWYSYIERRKDKWLVERQLNGEEIIDYEDIGSTDEFCKKNISLIYKLVKKGILISRTNEHTIIKSVSLAKLKKEAPR